MKNETGTEALGGAEKPKEGEKKPEKKAGEKKSGEKKTKGKKKTDGSKREMHIKELDDSSFHVQHSTSDKNGMPQGPQPEYSAATPEDLHDQIDQHFGGGGAADAGEDEDDEAADSQPPAGAGGPVT